MHKRIDVAAILHFLQCRDPGSKVCRAVTGKLSCASGVLPGVKVKELPTADLDRLFNRLVAGLNMVRSQSDAQSR